MNQENIFISTFRFVVNGLILDLVNFPVWWYSIGLKIRWLELIKNIKEANRRTALILWTKNLFVPMYGYYDIWSRLISFMMRLVLLPFKALIFFLWSMAYFLIFLIYFFLPPFFIFMIVRNY